MGYKLLLLLEKILMFLPQKSRKSFFSFLGWIAYKTSKRYRKVVEQNLNFAFDGKMSKKEIDEIARYSFKNLLYNFQHLMELRSMDKEHLKSKVKVINLDIIDKIHAEGRSIIYITPHYSSWEFTGVAGGIYFGDTILAVYKRMKNRVYEEWLLDARARFGNINLEKENVLKPLVRHIKNGTGAPGILIDTNINPKDGLIVNFMGKTIRQTSTPAFLARKFNAAIVPVATRTDDDENYTLMVFDEIVVEKSDDAKADILKSTQLQADWLTELITKEPKFWFWLHRRWKNDHPEIYES